MKQEATLIRARLKTPRAGDNPGTNKLLADPTLLAGARIVAETLESPGMNFPRPTADIKGIARKRSIAFLAVGN